MSIPDFERAEYVEPTIIDGETGYAVGSRRAANAALPLAILYGVGAAIVGAVGYALVGLSGFMVSIVTIAIGWLVAKSMMTATKGIGGRPFQVIAVVLTYVATSCGSLIDILYRVTQHGVKLSQLSPVSLAKYIVLGPILELMGHFLWGAIGLLILFYGLRTAWQMAAGSPGFGQQGGPRISFTGVR